MTASLKLSYVRGDVRTREEIRWLRTHPYPVVKSGVIRLRVGDDKFAGPLVTSIDANTGICKSLWTQKCHQLEEKVGLRFEQVWGFLPNGVFEQLGILPWYTIPGLRFSPMH